MAIYLNRTEFIIRRWVLSEEKFIPKKGRFTIGRSQDKLADGLFLSGDKKDLALGILKARSGIRFPTPEEVEAKRKEEEALYMKQREETRKKLDKLGKTGTLAFFGNGKSKKKKKSPVVALNKAVETDIIAKSQDDLVKTNSNSQPSEI